MTTDSSDSRRLFPGRQNSHQKLASLYTHCSGISETGPGGMRMFLPRTMGGGLVYELIIIDIFAPVIFSDIMDKINGMGPESTNQPPSLASRPGESEEEALVTPEGLSPRTGAFQIYASYVNWEILGSMMKIVFLKSKLNVFIPCGFLAILFNYVTQRHGWVFLLSMLGIIPLAERLGFATEQLALFTGPTGSILSNLLLVLGSAFFSGGLSCGKIMQTFSKADAVVNSGLLLMAVMGLLIPAALHYTHSEVQFGKSELALSRFSSCIMLVAYASYLHFQLSNNRHRNEAIVGASKAWDIPVAFISVVLLPIVGNSAGHVNAVIFAMKDRLDISLGIAIGSSIQISMFGIPFCVVLGWMMGKQMDLNFHLFETASLLTTVLVVAFLLQDGTSNCVKGFMLFLCYLIVSASFYVHADPHTKAGDKPPQN
uniref:Sodium/calcium exchanger membrane region domain-containing protein n=1 Tax=Oryza brachyantha TaxID=4533 RepID=J3L9H0_ORYBR